MQNPALINLPDDFDYKYIETNLLIEELPDTQENITVKLYNELNVEVGRGGLALLPARPPRSA